MNSQKCSLLKRKVRKGVETPAAKASRLKKQQKILPRLIIHHIMANVPLTHFKLQLAIKE
jgi:hypothetical protein